MPRCYLAFAQRHASRICERDLFLFGVGCAEFPWLVVSPSVCGPWVVATSRPFGPVFPASVELSRRMSTNIYLSLLSGHPKAGRWNSDASGAMSIARFPNAGQEEIRSLSYFLGCFSSGVRSVRPRQPLGPHLGSGPAWHRLSHVQRGAPPDSRPHCSPSRLQWRSSVCRLPPYLGCGDCTVTPGRAVCSRSGLKMRVFFVRRGQLSQHATKPGWTSGVPWRDPSTPPSG